MDNVFHYVAAPSEYVFLAPSVVVNGKNVLTPFKELNTPFQLFAFAHFSLQNPNIVMEVTLIINSWCACSRGVYSTWFLVSHLTL